jgi:hypothetical protein
MGESGHGPGLLDGSPLVDGQARLADAGWTGRERVVRPYALTGGRTEPEDSAVLDVVAVVAALPEGGAAAVNVAVNPEQQAILSRCGRPVAVRDLVSGLVSELGLPLGVVRVLLADLARQGLISAVRRRPREAGRLAPERPSIELLREVLRGLHAL